ncbi:MAG: hypothetical protein OXI60_06340 [Acidiferrobacterales bacterium]|nr:hypothetical protein [Acidiferrobacterales bacterium]
MNCISSTLDGVAIGSPQTHLNLTMFPLLGEKPVEIDYLLLDQALEQGAIEISEVSDSGSVPTLKVLNKSIQRVLLLDGEELVGAKQNRILNVSVMIPAQKTITIPVSCVEAGRWHRQSETFASAGRTHFAEGRARKTRAVNQSIHHSKSRSGDQSEVWDRISLKSARMQARSSTDASDEMYRTFRSDLDSFHNAFQAVPNQIGAIFSLNESTTGIDLFEATDALAASLNKLVESYALDAIDNLRRGMNGKSSFDAKKFLDDICAVTPEIHSAVGEGEDHRFDSGTLSGGGLVVDEKLVHLCAFHVVEENVHHPSRSRITRASSRNRGRRRA